MAKKVDFDFTDISGRGIPKYDWDSWLNGETWLLEHGVDFHIDINSFANLATNTAKRKGMGLSRHVNGNQIVIRTGELSENKIRSSRGPKSKYDWNHILSGEDVTLTQHVDFSNTPQMFVAYVRQMARLRKMRIESRIDGVTVRMRAIVISPSDATLPESEEDSYSS